MNLLHLLTLILCVTTATTTDVKLKTDIDLKLKVFRVLRTIGEMFQKASQVYTNYYELKILGKSDERIKENKALFYKHHIKPHQRYNLIFERLLQVTPDFYMKKHLHIIRNNKIAHAASSFGTVQVNEDFMQTLTNEEVQFVIAHEMSHCLLEHHFESNDIQKLIALSAFSVYMGIREYSNTMQLAGICMETLIWLSLFYIVFQFKDCALSRDTEYEADALAICLMERANMNVEKSISFFDRFIDSSTFEPFEPLTTHPVDSKRKERIRNHLKRREFIDSNTSKNSTQ